MGRRIRLIGSAVRKTAGWALVAAGLGLAATMLVPAVMGFERYVITGDSMTGTYDRGSLLYSKVVPVDELRVGDVITYVPPARTRVHGPVTHRITAIEHKRGERPVFRTRGDANSHADPWRFQLEQPSQARASLAIPYLGYAFAALSVREVRMGLIGLPALMIAIALVVGHWRDLGREAAEAAGTGAQSSLGQPTP